MIRSKRNATLLLCIAVLYVVPANGQGTKTIVVTSSTGSVYQVPSSAMEGYYNGQAALGQAQAAQIQAQAAMIKAAGDVATSNVKAAESLESARGKIIDNGVKAASIFYEKRKASEAFQAATDKPRATRDALGRMNRANQPPRADGLVNSDTGAIAWPELLDRPEFAAARQSLDEAFAQRANEPLGPGSEFILAGRQAAEKLRTLVKQNMREFSPAEYVLARKFVDALEAEIQRPPLAGGVAAK